MPRTRTQVATRWGIFTLSFVTTLVLFLHPADMDIAPPPLSIRLRIVTGIVLAFVSPLILPIPWFGRIALVICYPAVLFTLLCAGVNAWSMYNGTLFEGVH